jgi:hypothetical protein
VPGHPAVGVDDDLATGQPGVPHGAADLEPAGGVHQEPVAGGVDLQVRQHRVDDVVTHVRGEQFPQVDVGGVLGGHHDRVQPHRLIPDVLDRHLGLAVRAQVRDIAAAPDLGQPAGELVRQHDRHRHQLGGLPAREPEHEALVTGALAVQFVELAGALALAVLESLRDALGDIRGLGADRHRHPAGCPVVTLDRGVVPDLQDLLPDDAGNVDVGLRGHLAGHVHLASGDQGLHSNMTARVVLDHRVEDGVADLVRHLVRMTLRHRLGGKETSSHRTPISAVLRFLLCLGFAEV